MRAPAGYRKLTPAHVLDVADALEAGFLQHSIQHSLPVGISEPEICLINRGGRWAWLTSAAHDHPIAPDCKSSGYRRAELAPVSRAAVRNYTRRSPWLDVRDLEQEATVVALEAARTWRAGGTSRESWEAWKVCLKLARFVASQNSPVHVPDTRGRAGSRERAAWEAAAGARRAPLTVPGDFVGELEHAGLVAVATHDHVPAEDRIDRARETAEVRRILAGESEAARAVLLGEEKSAAVAKRLGLPRREVYDQTAAAMRKLREAFLEEAS